MKQRRNTDKWLDWNIKTSQGRSLVQLLNELKSGQIKVDSLLNSGRQKVEFKRMVFSIRVAPCFIRGRSIQDSSSATSGVPALQSGQKR